MEHVKIAYKQLFSDRTFWFSVVVAFILLFASFGANYAAGVFATENVSNPVTDVILDNVKVRDVDEIFIYGPMVLWMFVIFLLLYYPHKIPFTVKSIAIFIFIRSVFISLTHIAPFPGQPVLPPSDVTQLFTFGGDLFFSAHTGLPFLLALLFWNIRTLRYIFLITSILFGVVVLLGHYHYSIDVFGAFFITYAIAAVARVLFKKDLETFMSSPPAVTQAG